MPLVHLSVPASYEAERAQRVARGVHDALVAAIGIPEGDRFQLIIRHTVEEVIFDPNYLDIERREVIYIEITLVGGRDDEKKRALYREIAERLAPAGVRSEDVFVVLTENGRADWSVGNGIAQLLESPAGNERHAREGAM